MNKLASEYPKSDSIHVKLVSSAGTRTTASQVPGRNMPSNASPCVPRGDSRSIAASSDAESPALGMRLLHAEDRSCGSSSRYLGCLGTSGDFPVLYYVK